MTTLAHEYTKKHFEKDTRRVSYWLKWEMGDRKPGPINFMNKVYNWLEKMMKRVKTIFCLVKKYFWGEQEDNKPKKTYRKTYMQEFVELQIMQPVSSYSLSFILPEDNRVSTISDIEYENLIIDDVMIAESQIVLDDLKLKWSKEKKNEMIKTRKFEIRGEYLVAATSDEVIVRKIGENKIAFKFGSMIRIDYINAGKIESIMCPIYTAIADNNKVIDYIIIDVRLAVEIVEAIDIMVAYHRIGKKKKVMFYKKQVLLETTLGALVLFQAIKQSYVIKLKVCYKNLLVFDNSDIKTDDDFSTT